MSKPLCPLVGIHTLERALRLDRILLKFTCGDPVTQQLHLAFSSGGVSRVHEDMQTRVFICPRHKTTKQASAPTATCTRSRKDVSLLGPAVNRSRAACRVHSLSPLVTTVSLKPWVYLCAAVNSPGNTLPSVPLGMGAAGGEGGRSVLRTALCQHFSCHRHMCFFIS